MRFQADLLGLRNLRRSREVRVPGAVRVTRQQHLADLREPTVTVVLLLIAARLGVPWAEYHVIFSKCLRHGLHRHGILFGVTCTRTVRTASNTGAGHIRGVPLLLLGDIYLAHWWEQDVSEEAWRRRWWCRYCCWWWFCGEGHVVSTVIDIAGAEQFHTAQTHLPLVVTLPLTNHHQQQ